MNFNVVKGTRDFLPQEMNKRNYIFNTIKEVFLLHGFSQIETPAMENLSTLMGKYGEEGDKLLYKILNSGNFLEKVENLNEELDYKKLTPKICQKGLRYDLTVPFARFVVNHQNDISFPFKRYQIQPVWRADRPQKGRYREFYQCDCDIIGSNSLLNEVEIIEILDEVFNRLSLNVEIKISNRKILSAIAQLINREDKLIEITTSIDKMDKIGYDKVVEDLITNGLTLDEVNKITPILKLEGDISFKLDKLKEIFSALPIGLKGIEEMYFIMNNIKNLNIKSEINLDLTLARGLNYYTGTIIEVKVKDMPLGSIAGGGRYDNLTKIFGLDNLSGVGVSFGADRIYDALEQLSLFDENIEKTSTIMFVNFGEKEAKICNIYAQELRNEGIKTELYPDNVKIQKQMKYANDKKIPFVGLVGEKEMAENKIQLKDMISGKQETLSLIEVKKIIEGK
ncbi:MAG: histidine--tRNA ligase [Bacteroidales bacterium]|jgi:histidyl-tRNA synthetase|nr:histidine--tRNA ligase [Bacteroidales bacterium]